MRVGIGGPVGSGKSALVEQLVRRFARLGIETLVATGDAVTTAEGLRCTPGERVEPERSVEVETGARPRTAVREDPTMRLAAPESPTERYPNARVALVEGDGDNLTPTSSRRPVDYAIYVIDVASGDTIPRERGPGMLGSDLLVINEQNPAPHARASLDAMAADCERLRDGKPYVFANCKSGEGVDDVMEYLTRALAAAEARMCLGAGATGADVPRTGACTIRATGIATGGKGRELDVRFHATLRQHVGGRHVVVPWAEGMTVWGFIHHVVEVYPGLRDQLLDKDGSLFRHVHVMVNGRDAPYLKDGLDTPLSPRDSIDVFPPVGGGA